MRREKGGGRAGGSKREERRHSVVKTESEEESLTEDDRQREGARNKGESWRARQGEVSQIQPAGQTDTERAGERGGLTETGRAREAGRVREKRDHKRLPAPTHCLLDFHL